MVQSGVVAPFPFVFSLGVVIVVFAYSAFQRWQQAKTERLLIEKGEAGRILELRQQWLERRLMRNPFMGLALGAAAVISAGILWWAGQPNVALWFLIGGVFELALGAGRWFGRR